MIMNEKKCYRNLRRRKNTHARVQAKYDGMQAVLIPSVHNITARQHRNFNLCKLRRKETGSVG